MILFFIIRCEEGKKVALLQQNSFVIQKDLEKIDMLIDFVKQYESNGSKLQFLINYKQIEEKVNSEISKPLKSKFILTN